MTEDEAAGFVRSLGVSLNVHEVEQAVKYLVASCGNHAVLQEFLKPVSYTHLDVYKRQGWEAAGRKYPYPEPV